MTRWSSAISIRADVKVFSLKTRKTTAKPMAIRTSPANNRRHGHGRPAEAMIEGRYKQQAHEADRGKEHDELLLGLRLRGRPAGQAALQQRRIVLGEIGRDEERRAEKCGKKQSALPVTQRSCRGEEQPAHDEGQGDISKPGFYVHADHGLYRRHHAAGLA